MASGEKYSLRRTFTIIGVLSILLWGIIIKAADVLAYGLTGEHLF